MEKNALLAELASRHPQTLIDVMGEQAEDVEEVVQ
jgi:hypothetical protein